MLPAFAYDITRLVTRVFNVTPNGIDRVDSGFARHYLAADAPSERFGAIWSPLGPRLMPVGPARAALEGIAAHWGETRAGGDDPVYAAVVARLKSGGAGAVGPTRIARGRSGRTRAVARWFASHGLPLGRTPERHLPRGARYVNVSQFPLWVPSYFEWLERRRDVKAVFFIHDLLPLELPEYFRAAEAPRHAKRMANLARFGAGAVVTTPCVKEALDAHLASIGRAGFPVLVAPTPMSPTFLGARDPDPALAGAAPYFVVCSTIEPRKNHLTLLHAWRELVRRAGDAAPRLLVIGNRGWHFGPVVDLLERSPALRRHVIEVRGLSTPGLRALLDGARALLMPTFGEGYGLPAHEALAARVPAIVSDVPAFRDIDDPLLTRLSPLDGEGWLEAVRAAAAGPARPAAARAPAVATSWEDYFARVDGFAADL